MWPVSVYQTVSSQGIRVAREADFVSDGVMIGEEATDSAGLCGHYDKFCFSSQLDGSRWRIVSREETRSLW